MGYITLAVLILTLAALGFGALFGMMRGRNRAILRLILVVVSIVLAVALRGVIVNVVMDINVGDGTVKETLLAAFNEGDASLPSSMTDLLLALVEIIVGMIAFFLLFIVLRLLTWILIFPILKIFVKKGAKKRKGWGALIGTIQGLLIAFVMCSPITGIVVQMDKISDIKINGEQLLELPEEIGLDKYSNSFLCKVYSFTGGWFFDMVTSTKTADGNKVSIEDTVDVVVAVTGIADTLTTLTDSIGDMTNSDSPQDQVNAMKNVGDTLVAMGNSINSLSGDAKDMINGLISSVKDMVTEDGDAPELEAFFEEFDIQDLNLASVGSAINGIATYIEKTTEGFEGHGTPVAQEEVTAIINGLADNSFILDMIAPEGEEVPTLVPVTETNKAMFENAINGTSLSQDKKDILKGLFGIE